MNDTLERAVRMVLSDYLDAAPPWRQLSDADRAPESSPPDGRWRPWVVALAGASVAAGVTGVVVVARDGTGGPASSPTTSIGTASPAESSSPTEASRNPGLRPTALPEDLHIAQVLLFPADYVPPERPDQGTLFMVVGRIGDETEGVTARIDVSVDWGRMFAPPTGEFSQWTREAITIRGIPGEVVRDTVNDAVIVEYQVGEQVVTVQSREGDEPDVFETMLSIAESITVDEDTAEYTGDVPGFEVLAESPVPPDDPVATLYYSDGTNVREITVAFRPDPPADFEYWFMDDGLDAITVRGHPAYATRHEPPDGMPAATPGLSVMWLEAPDLLVSVSGYDDITLDEVIAAAESLQPMTDAEFAALQEQASVAGGAATTSVVTGPSEATPVSMAD